ncbi:ABC transporter ATP-binding protein [Marinobacterium mangrovicola]|uniref:Peptide/nickel transport system ATP-binding protein n=1 Tax=Marinobacterium mangrovicola TaxID=1476959 RepID=A0A4R1GP49_9GAMM|nr:ATP-binding cassette domain-containing protein [Marinobacterium mangrovicola]TCK09171.1 peptide/nickel transport system ATP-binding protein [Marinobacterium mangrovicola]
MLEAKCLTFGYPRQPAIVDGVSLTLRPGEITGLTGPSGCGKSTLGRLLAGVLKPQSGSIQLAEPRGGVNPVQYLHQSPIFAVNPRWRIGRIIEEAWAPDEATREALGVSRDWYNRFPHEISGGELQRVAILRALAPEVRYLIADEITAMLDPITQADIWSFLMQRSCEGLSILAISHDRHLLQRIASKEITLTRLE